MSSFSHLIQIKREILSILRKRGFPCNTEEDEYIDKLTTYEEFLNLYNNFKINYNHNPVRKILIDKKRTSHRVLLSTLHEKDNGDKIIVFFGESQEDKQSVSVDESKLIDQLLIQLDIKEAIFITTKKLTPSARSKIEHAFIPKNRDCYFIQHFQDDELMYDPIQHTYVPEHTILSEEETKKFLENNKIKGFQLNQIPTSDPIIKRSGGRVGQVVQIEADNFIPGTLLDKTLSYSIIVA